jgi:hypothetical protein
MIVKTLKKLTESFRNTIKDSQGRRSLDFPNQAGIHRV